MFLCKFIENCVLSSFSVVILRFSSGMDATMGPLHTCMRLPAKDAYDHRGCRCVARHAPETLLMCTVRGACHTRLIASYQTRSRLYLSISIIWPKSKNHFFIVFSMICWEILSISRSRDREESIPIDLDAFRQNLTYFISISICFKKQISICLVFLI